MSKPPEWLQKQAGKEVMSVVAANIPKRIADLLKAEAKAAGATMSSVVAQALITGRPDLPWEAKE